MFPLCSPIFNFSLIDPWNSTTSSSPYRRAILSTFLSYHFFVIEYRIVPPAANIRQKSVQNCYFVCNNSIVDQALIVTDDSRLHVRMMKSSWAKFETSIRGPIFTRIRALTMNDHPAFLHKNQPNLCDPVKFYKYICQSCTLYAVRLLLQFSFSCKQLHIYHKARCAQAASSLSMRPHFKT